MKTLIRLILLMLAVPRAIAQPLALRVEVAPLPGTDDGPTLQIVAQLAPEDRTRVGREARLRVRLLDEDDDTLLHLLRDVVVDDEGATSTEVTWAPGTYTLEVTLEAVRGRASGLWAGTITIPEAPPRSKAVKPVAIEPARAPTLGDSDDASTKPTAAPSDDRTLPAPTASPTDEDTAALAAEETLSSEASQEHLSASPPEARTASVPPAEPVAADAPPKPAMPSQTALPVRMVIALDVTAPDSSRATGIAKALEHRALSEGGRSVTFLAEDAATQNAPGILRAALLSSQTSYFGAPLILITDGRRQAGDGEWREALAAARSGGVPVLAVGLWSTDFPPKVQNRLRKIASVSDGRVFFLQGADTTATIVALYEEARKAGRPQ